jgi:hypothetical protein
MMGVIYLAIGMARAAATVSRTPASAPGPRHSPVQASGRAGQRSARQPIATARRLTSMATVLSRSAALVAAVLTVSGCGGATAAAGRPVPASAVPRLTVIAERAAQLNGDRHPAWATAVLTTHAQALKSATPGDTVSNRRRVPVYLVTIRGQFVCNACTGPAGAKAPSGRYISLVVDAKGFTGMDFGISPKPPPVAPASLGPVTYLIGQRR